MFINELLDVLDVFYNFLGLFFNEEYNYSGFFSLKYYFGKNFFLRFNEL